jgi:hypothetical protein
LSTNSDGSVPKLPVTLSASAKGYGIVTVRPSPAAAIAVKSCGVVTSSGSTELIPNRAALLLITAVVSMANKIVGVFKNISLKKSRSGHFDGWKSSAAITIRSGVVLSKREAKIAGDVIGSQITSSVLCSARKRR